MSKPPSPAPKKPRAEPPVHEPASGGGEALAAAKEMAEARKRWSPSAKQIGVGAAIGVGSAAVVAAMLYWRGNRK